MELWRNSFGKHKDVFVRKTNEEENEEEMEEEKGDEENDEDENGEDEVGETRWLGKQRLW